MLSAGIIAGIVVGVILLCCCCCCCWWFVLAAWRRRRMKDRIVGGTAAGAGAAASPPQTLLRPKSWGGLLEATPAVAVPSTAVFVGQDGTVTETRNPLQRKPTADPSAGGMIRRLSQRIRLAAGILPTPRPAEPSGSEAPPTDAGGASGDKSTPPPSAREGKRTLGLQQYRVASARGLVLSLSPGGLGGGGLASHSSAVKSARALFSPSNVASTPAASSQRSVTGFQPLDQLGRMSQRNLLAGSPAPAAPAPSADAAAPETQAQPSLLLRTVPAPPEPLSPAARPMRPARPGPPPSRTPTHLTLRPIPGPQSAAGAAEDSPRDPTVPPTPAPEPSDPPSPSRGPPEPPTPSSAADPGGARRPGAAAPTPRASPGRARGKYEYGGAASGGQAGAPLPVGVGVVKKDEVLVETLKLRPVSHVKGDPTFRTFTMQARRGKGGA